MEKTDKELLREWLSETNVVFSLTTAMRSEIERQMKEMKKEDLPLHKSYIPGYPVELFNLDGEDIRKSQSVREISMLTPMKSDENCGT